MLLSQHDTYGEKFLQHLGLQLEKYLHMTDKAGLFWITPPAKQYS